jgi:hypothetical protein
MIKDLSVDENIKKKLNSEIRKLEDIFDLENDKNLIKA